MQDTKKDFFISYNKNDRRWGEWIAWQLEQEGFSVIIQAWDFLPGTNFALKIQEATTVAKQMIAVLSQDYLNAPFTQAEWATAFIQDPTGQKRTLLPIRVRECTLTGLLASIVYIDLLESDESTARSRLLRGVSNNRTKPTIAPAFPGKRSASIRSSGAANLLPERPPFPKDLPPTTKAIKIFYAYAPEDKDLREELEKQLGLLRKLGLITEWHSGQIGAGKEWAREIESHWQAAQIILLLISANFIASDAYLMAEKAVKRHEEKTALVVPIILRPVDWRGAVFDHIKVFPSNEKPVTSWADRQEAFLDVAQGIRSAVEEFYANS
ncbi:MAG TPA: toll/interleukin-1 receptor domain-containing protein [Ktedonobacteraceae bacterium]|nr:toll/interleukin-1 receptor domain-containing protein [Ktedonobacteraceae bacterium]